MVMGVSIFTEPAAVNILPKSSVAIAKFLLLVFAYKELVVQPVSTLFIY